MLLAPISVGELIDKITILEIKEERIADESKRVNVRHELEALRLIETSNVPTDRIDELREVNRALWDIEDEIREKERMSEFDERFVELARSVYFTNDRRSRIKRSINEISGSDLIEEKSYNDPSL
jgi:hypothetical protein